jgi:hypothetical protein
MKSWMQIALVFAAAVTVAGCGDDAPGMNGSPDGGMRDASSTGAGPSMDGSVDARSPDAEPDAGDDAGDADAGADAGTPNSCTLDTLLVVVGDFSTARLASVDLDSGDVRMREQALEDADTVLDRIGCTTLLLERARGRIAVQQRDAPLSTSHRMELDPEGVSEMYASNPQGVVDHRSGQPHAILLARNELLQLDPSRSGRDAVTGAVDLSSMARDPDGFVDASDAIHAGERLYVALGHYWFDEELKFDGSSIAVIDTDSDAPVDMDADADGTQGIALEYDNPWRGMWMDAENDRMWVAATGRNSMRDGAIEEIDLAQGQSTGPVVTEQTLDAEIKGFTRVGPQRLLVHAGREVVALDPTADPLEPETVVQNVDGMHGHETTLFVWSRQGESPSLRRFNARTGTETTPEGADWTFEGNPVSSVVLAP